MSKGTKLCLIVAADTNDVAALLRGGQPGGKEGTFSGYFHVPLRMRIVPRP